MGIHRDLLLEGARLEGYKLLLTPYMPYVSADYLQRALAFVKEGGIWIAGPLTGGRTEQHTMPTDAALGKLEHEAGVETVHTYPMDDTGAMGKAFGCTAPLGMWSALFEPREVTAKAVGSVAEGITPGFSFLTEREYGRGKLVMLGSMPQGENGDAMLKKLIDHYCMEAGVTLRSDVTPGTIVAPRRGDGLTFWIVINMNGAGGSVTLPVGGTDAVSNMYLPPGRLEIGRYEYRAIQFKGTL